MDPCVIPDPSDPFNDNDYSKFYVFCMKLVVEKAIVGGLITGCKDDLDTNCRFGFNDKIFTLVQPGEEEFGRREPVACSSWHADITYQYRTYHIIPTEQTSPFL